MTSTAANADFSILYNTESLFSVGLDAVFTDATFETPPSNIHGYLQYLSVKFDVDIDVQAMMDIIEQQEAGTTTYTNEQILEMLNGEIDAQVLVSGNKAADIVIEFDAVTQDLVPVFVYTDGTSEPAEQYLEGFFIELEDFFDFLEDF